MRRMTILLAMSVMSIYACSSQQTPPEQATALATAPSLASLKNFVGKYPAEIKLWESPPLRGRLRALLGEHYQEFLVNMQVTGPLIADGNVAYVTGNKPHSGGSEAAIFLAEIESNRIHVWLMVNEIMAEYHEPGPRIKLPREVETMVNEMQPMKGAN